MKTFNVAAILVLLAMACSSPDIRNIAIPIEVVPIPKEVQSTSQGLVLPSESRVFVANGSVDLPAVLNSDFGALMNYKVQATQDRGQSYFEFLMNEDLDREEYTISISEKVIVRAGSPQGWSLARSTLLQLIYEENGEYYLPLCKIKDSPSTAYRGLMIDLARKWHGLETIKRLIDLASYYKTNYLQLHFTDYQSYTLPSRKYPKLSTEGRHYTFQELEEMEKYASDRGVTIIPEIDIPGHSSAIVEAYPEIFALKDKDQNPWIINMGKEQVYEALEEIIGEIIPIFKRSPYFHIGGDEAIFDKTLEDPDVIEYMQSKQLGTDVHELYRHFLIRMNDIVKRHGKQMCVWEGFRREGNIQIPRDILVYEFETNRYLPNHLVQDGYTVVNTSWKPLYVVNQKKWEPKTIYGWNMWRWENWYPKAPSIVPIQLEETPLVIGAQMCAWEQKEKLEFKSLRMRLPVMNERLWNTEEAIPYADFMDRLEVTNTRLSDLVKDDSQDSLLHGHNYVAPD